MATIKFEGITELQKKLAKNIELEEVKRVVRFNGQALQKGAQNKAQFKGHWGWEKGKGRVFKKPTGKLKESIGLEFEDNGLTAKVEPSVEYAAYVEFGTRFMNAQPYLKPAFDVQVAKFKSDMQKLVK